ncbi:DUF190 domain-containing protein [Pampinifervens florentissimum]|uniref:DUF190 domain-containing protein n=1 Tax=Pampinifervens florentissimum TaxID=1632019 RepID=UPI0013B4813C|nr:DUF190 domain-containing protein [Hydrogenobacter sp. T-8]QID34148.1 DUF190 domain-containing protein [Hydrogenobacter sp. T-8]
MQCETALLVRMFFGEDDKYEGKPLYRYVVEFCKEKGVAGATVFRGILGYGKSSVIHKAGIFSLSSDLPIVVEIVDCEEKIQEILPELSKLVKDGIITLERVKVIKA